MAVSPWCPQQGGWGAGSGVRWAHPCSREGYPMFISSCANEGRQGHHEGTFPWLTTFSSPPGVAVPPRARCVPANPLWCPRGMRGKNHSCGTSLQQGWQENREKTRVEPVDASALPQQENHTHRAWPCPSLLLPTYPRIEQKDSLLKRNIKTSF